MDMIKGADAHTLEEAEAFIRDFIRELRNDTEGKMRRHSGDYDLFLPWLWEEVVNSGTHLEPTHVSNEQNRLFMEAAWSLVMKGFLRPGPVKVSSVSGGHDYGKGYSVTHSGEEWLKESSASPAVDSDER